MVGTRTNHFYKHEERSVKQLYNFNLTTIEWLGRNYPHSELIQAKTIGFECLPDELYILKYPSNGEFYCLFVRIRGEELSKYTSVEILKRFTCTSCQDVLVYLHNMASGCEKIVLDPLEVKFDWNYSLLGFNDCNRVCELQGLEDAYERWWMATRPCGRMNDEDTFDCVVFVDFGNTHGETLLYLQDMTEDVIFDTIKEYIAAVNTQNPDKA